MVAEEVTFFNQGLQLAGSLYKPQDSIRYPALIVLHAADGGTRQYPFYQHLTTYLPAQGMAVLLYDRRGSGQSTGDFETSDFEDLAGDASAAVDYLTSRNDIDSGHIGIYGISQGGWIAPIVAAERPRIAFIIIVSGCGVSPARQMDYGASYTLREAGYPEEIVAQALTLRNQVNEYYRGNLPHAIIKTELDQMRDEPWVQYAYLPDGGQLPEDVTQDKWYYELDFDPLPIWRQVQQPTLFLFPTEDRWVPIEESISKFRAATMHLQEVAIERIEGADHLMHEISSEAAHISDRYVEVLLSGLTKMRRIDSWH